MSVTQPKAVSVGQNITLTCQVNIPLTDVTLRWTVAGKKLNKRLLGHLHPHRGVSEVTLTTIRPEDYGIYSCVATYTLGGRIVIDMKASVLEGGKLFLSCMTKLFIIMYYLLLSCMVKLFNCAMEMELTELISYNNHIQYIIS